MSLSDAARRAPAWGLVLLVAAFVLLPIASLTLTSFRGEGWRELFAQPAMGDALLNTVSLGLVRQAISIVLGAFIAWLIARSDLPGRRWLEVGFWIALFMPPLPAALGWVMLLGGSSGLVNQALFALPFVDAPVFNLYSWWGIVWVHLMGATLALKVFLLVPAFRALDASLEEAARTSGASLWRTFTHIVVPVMAPAITVILLIGLIRSMQAFEVELILGEPAGIEVYSTEIYRAMTQEPPQLGLASALSIAFLVTLTPLVVLHQGYVRRSGVATLTGRVRTRPQQLGRLKWPLFAAVSTLLALMTLAPLVCLLLSTFMRLFGQFDMPDPWTLDNWRAALGRGDTLPALWNTLRLGIGASVTGMIVFTAIAYLAVRSESRAARVVDFLTWLPVLVPGVVLSLGLLQVFSGIPIFRVFYGSMAALIAAILIGAATVGVQVIKTSLRQLGRELEEAGWASGGSRWLTLRKIVLPLIAPAIAVVGLEVFASANAAVAVVSLLGAGPTTPLSILQLNLLTSGQFEAASVVGLTIMALTVGSALLARFVADRAGLESER